MSDRIHLAEQFERARPRLQSVAYGTLSSVSEAEDAVQEAWLRLDRSDADVIKDVRTWRAALETLAAHMPISHPRRRRSNSGPPRGRGPRRQRCTRS
jgi:RNA polymerase sigma-70 factor (ECF subfamily)